MAPTDPMELLAFRTVSDQSDLTTSSPVNLLLVSVQLQLSTVNPPLDGCFCLLDH